MKVLIGITTRNRAEILAKAIESALAQDYPEKQIAVFDDASTDETWRLRESYPQVRWFQANEQQGILKARNKLMRETDATFYFSLDDDAWFIRGDEISLGVNYLLEHPEIGALAYDILSPDYSEPKARSAPYKTHMFIGCGHLLRLSATQDVGFYIPSPGFYGSEEKDLCVRLLDHGFEVMYLPGVHVWHDKTMHARDIPAQHRSGVCNDFVFALRRCPVPLVLWLIPGKVISHLRFAVTHNLLRPYISGLVKFLISAPTLLQTRKPVSRSTFREYLTRSRAHI
jgi:GT2 family glycosyltransferase